MDSWKRVCSEETIVKFILSDNEIVVCVSGQAIKYWSRKVIINSLFVLGVISTLNIFVHIVLGNFSIRHTIVLITNIIQIILFGVAIYTRGRHSSSVTSIYKKITEMDDRLKTSSKDKLDLVPVYLTALILISLIYNLVLSFLVLKNYSLIGIFRFVPIMICSYYLMEISIIKHQIAKRLRMVRSEEEPVDQVEQLMENTRELLEYNTRLNTDFELIVTVAVVSSFMHFVTFSFNLWLIQGAKEDFPFAYEKYPVITTLRNICYYGMLFIIVYFSSMVDEEVKGIQTELDICLTGRPCSNDLKNKITMYLLELAHTPVVINGLGLFDVTCSSFVTACSLIVTYLMVLIQFS